MTARDNKTMKFASVFFSHISLNCSKNQFMVFCRNLDYLQPFGFLSSCMGVFACKPKPILKHQYGSYLKIPDIPEHINQDHTYPKYLILFMLLDENLPLLINYDITKNIAGQN